MPPAAELTRRHPEAEAIIQRRSKFTPERLEQIRDLVAVGKSREDIAGLMGVTVGTLQVTCSKRGISLRRPPGSNLPAHEAAPRPNDIEPQQGDAANLALTMRLRGRQRTVPLRLSKELITALALESQLREMSLGQLVGEIVAGAVAAGLSGLLDGARPSADAASRFRD